MMRSSTMALGLALAALAAPAAAQTDGGGAGGMAMPEGTQGMMSPGLVIPRMDAAEGARLFASKGCVVCHSVNGVGGEDAPALDAANMDLPMNPFDFAASMWRGAEAMVALQREELGAPIELSGDELASIIAFVHDERQQMRFSSADIPPAIAALMPGADAQAGGMSGMTEGGGSTD